MCRAEVATGTLGGFKGVRKGTHASTPPTSQTLAARQAFSKAPLSISKWTFTTRCLQKPTNHHQQQQQQQQQQQNISAMMLIQVWS